MEIKEREGNGRLANEWITTSGDPVSDEHEKAISRRNEDLLGGIVEKQ